MSLAAHQQQVSAASASASEALRAYSQRQFTADWQAHDARAARGLVSVSTTCRDVPTAIFWSENCITVDREQARITRLRKAVGMGAKALHNAGGHGQTKWLVTLTYDTKNTGTTGHLYWKPEQISRFLDAMRKWHYKRTGSKKVRYAWVAELQQRGAVHYHVVVWLAKGMTLPKPDKQGWWPHGMSNRKEATQPIGYLMKYVSKVSTKNVGGFPHGARIHGVGGLDDSGRACKRWVLWPSYVQGNAAAGDKFRPALGGGYVNADTGEFLRSEWAPTGGGFNSFIRVRRTPRVIEADGPFSWAPGHAVTVH